MKPAGEERVTQRFAAYAADGTRYVVEEFRVVYQWGGGHHRMVPTEWPGPRQYRLFDGTPLEKGPHPGEFSFRDPARGLVRLTTDNPGRGSD